MVTNCTKCGSCSPKCGCQDTMLTTPTAYPTPVGCPSPEPCSEILNAQCIIYMGDPIMCGSEILIPTNTSVAEALQLIVAKMCTP